MYRIKVSKSIQFMTTMCFTKLVQVAPDLYRKAKGAFERVGTGTLFYRGFEFQPFEDGDYYLIVTAKKSLCDGDCVSCRLNDRCPFVRAAQGFLTLCSLLESFAESSPANEELSGEDVSSSSAPGSEEAEQDSSEPDKQAEFEEGTLPRLQDSTEVESVETCSQERSQTTLDLGAESKAPSPEQVVEDNLNEELGEGDSEICSAPNASSQPEALGHTQTAEEGSPAPASPEHGEQLSGESEGCEVGASGSSDSLEHRPAGARKAGNEESCIEEAGQGSSSVEEGGESSLTGDYSAPTSKGNGSLWEMAFNPEEDQHVYGGGGGQACALSARDATASVEKQITLFLRRLLSEIEDLFRREEGKDRWDTRKVICSSAFAPHCLLQAKFSRPRSRRISLWVDVSGSVSHLANFIIKLITAACKDHDVQVVIGSEAHPETVLPSDFVRSGKDWSEYRKGRYAWDFADQVELFLRRERLERGCTIIIWSDYMDIHANDLDKLARLFRPYRVVWLCSHNGKNPDYWGNESFKLERFAKKEGHLFLWGIDSTEGIKKALKEINIKKRRQL